MNHPQSPAPSMTDGLLKSLQQVATKYGAVHFDNQITSLQGNLAQDLAAIEHGVASIAEFAASTAAGGPAAYLLTKGGKRLRPFLVMLASHCGSGVSPASTQLALSVELVHNATLLHDDVVDLGDARRGAPTARAVYGNAASIFAGDWLLLEALRCIHNTGMPHVMETMLDVVQEMIDAEVKQLAQRGRGVVDLVTYFDVISGKTAALFGWATMAGAIGGGLEDTAESFKRFGHHLGIAFQIVDDLLDVQGDPSKIGKDTFADLSEGKMTLPTILAAHSDDEAAAVFSALCSGTLDVCSSDVRERIAECFRRSESIPRAKTIAEQHIDYAVAALSAVPDSSAKRLLVAVARATVHRNS
ncbi:MAG: polyprenyl synthetase family protein [Myxococcales bacterium]|nr:polyprenyl synthetase family protein [Myxococcales bacterium]